MRSLLSLFIVGFSLIAGGKAFASFQPSYDHEGTVTVCYQADTLNVPAGYGFHHANWYLERGATEGPCPVEPPPVVTPPPSDVPTEANTPPRGDYCSIVGPLPRVAPDTTSGVFLNLLRTDVLDNPTYAHKVVFAPFYQGVGTSCDRYGGVHDTGLRVGEDGLVSGNPTGDVYELFVH